MLLKQDEWCSYSWYKAFYVRKSAVKIHCVF
ncbi:hypothetical protein CF65_00123 [Aggregatibacter actinomycetemcomitans HK1651]|nr:hypothetical protein CF65_00123 [Aggregatibacter actinomycetemcomitans HK1651]